MGRGRARTSPLQSKGPFLTHDPSHSLHRHASPSEEERKSREVKCLAQSLTVETEVVIAVTTVNIYWANEA